MTLDAGTSSGLAWALLHLEDCEDLTSFEIVHRDLIDTSTILEDTEKKSAKLIVERFEHLVFNWNVRKAIPLNRIFLVVEDFILREGSHSSKRSGLSSPRIVSLVDGMLSKYKWLDIDAHKQSPSNAKTTATNKRLQANKLWVPGCPHENDAIRHLVLWTRKTTQTGL